MNIAEVVDQQPKVEASAQTRVYEGRRLLCRPPLVANRVKDLISHLLDSPNNVLRVEVHLGLVSFIKKGRVDKVPGGEVAPA